MCPSEYDIIKDNLTNSAQTCWALIVFNVPAQWCFHFQRWRCRWWRIDNDNIVISCHGRNCQRWCFLGNPISVHLTMMAIHFAIGAFPLTEFSCASNVANADGATHKIRRVHLRLIGRPETIGTQIRVNQLIAGCGCWDRGRRKEISCIFDYAVRATDELAYKAHYEIYAHTHTIGLCVQYRRDWSVKEATREQEREGDERRSGGDMPAKRRVNKSKQKRQKI